MTLQPPIRRQGRLAACALALAAVSLAACDEGPSRTGAARGLCYDFRNANAPTGDGAPAIENCTRRWAYALASSRDEADLVAEAVAGACATQLTRWNQQSLAAPEAVDGAPTSILTGEPTTAIAEHNSFTRSRALFYVVQARAGGCSPPPFKDGVPEGVG